MITFEDLTQLTMITFEDLMKLSDEDIISIYLDYFNNFLTLEKFAEHYNLNETDAYYFIKLGKRLNDNTIKK